MMTKYQYASKLAGLSLRANQLKLDLLEFGNDPATEQMDWAEFDKFTTMLDNLACWLDDEGNK